MRRCAAARPRMLPGVYLVSLVSPFKPFVPLPLPMPRVLAAPPPSCAFYTPYSTLPDFNHLLRGVADFAVGEKLKFEGREEMLKEQKAVEYEDSEGNVYDANVYTQLVKQGVIQPPR